MIISREQWDELQSQLSDVRARLRRLEGRPSCCEHPMLAIEGGKRVCKTCGAREA